MQSSTNWPAVTVLLLAGVVGACQIGKAAIAVPLLQRELGLTLVAAAWIVGAYGTVAALAGMPAGIVVARFGGRRAVVAGLLTIGIGGVLGAAAPGGGVLLASRIAEGLGFLSLVIGVPTLLRNVSAERDRNLVFTCWAAYMPTGSAFMMLAGPALTPFGWQALWLVNGAAALAFGAVALAALPAEPRRPAAEGLEASAVRRVLKTPGPRLLAFAFGTYTFQYFALTGLLPALLVERRGLTLAAAGAVSAFTVVANALGNLAAGLLLRFMIPLWVIIAGAFAVMGLASVGIFAEAVPVAVVAALAAGSLAVTGLIPASVFIATPRLVPQGAMLAVTFGLVMQASNLGQLLGPVALGRFVQQAGWSAAPILFGAVALIGIATALRLRGLLRREGA